MEDLENRSRHNIVRLQCLTEGKDGDNLKECIAKIHSEGLSMDVACEFEIERPHRSPGSQPDDDQPPRLIMITFLCFSTRDKVLKAA